MSSGDTIKTTVRLPADLHWKFQSERTRRRLSNEKAIVEAFELWISNPVRAQKLAKDAKSRRSRVLHTSPLERECVESLLRILRDQGNSACSTAIQVILKELAGQTDRQPAHVV